MKNLTKQYLTNPDAVLLLFDCTNLDTFLKTKEWAEFISDKVSSKTIKYIIRNKIDRIDISVDGSEG